MAELPESSGTEGRLRVLATMMAMSSGDMAPIRMADSGNWKSVYFARDIPAQAPPFRGSP